MLSRFQGASGSARLRLGASRLRSTAIASSNSGSGTELALLPERIPAEHHLEKDHAQRVNIRA